MTKKVFPYVLILPMFIVFIVFIGIPIFSTIQGSVIDIDGTFLGLSNFFKVFSDNLFFKSIFNTLLLIFMYLLLKIPIVIILASIIQKLDKGKRIILTIFFIPSTIGFFTYGIIFRFLFSEDGFINSILNIFGFKLAFLDNGFLAILVIAIAMFISTFGVMVLMLLISVNNNISKEMFDASEIDGANFIQRIRFITIPYLWPIIKLYILFAVLECIALIDIPYQLTSGGPNNSTTTIGYYIYKQAIEYGRFSYASTLSFLVLIVLLVILYLTKYIRGDDIASNY